MTKRYQAIHEELLRISEPKRFLCIVILPHFRAGKEQKIAKEKSEVTSETERPIKETKLIAS